MSKGIDRRDFLRRSAGAAAALSGISGGAAAAGPKRAPARLKKAVIYGMLPDTLPMPDRFKLARDVGFEGVEISPVGQADAEAMRHAAEAAGIPIHSVIYGGWGAPMSSADEATIAKGQAEIEAALRCAKWAGAEGILLVPAVVNASTRYVDAYRRSQANIRKLVPLAAELQISINIEEVWNNFLLSPIEFAEYVSSFRSPWVNAYFDVGNVVRFGWPQDWIRTLGKRIRKVHLKDFKGGPGLGIGGQWVNLGEGSIDWPEVKKALQEVGYAGYVTTELGGGDETYLRDLVARIDRLLTGS